MKHQNPFQKPVTIWEKFERWKTDLDRTQGNEWEAVIGRYIDRQEIKVMRSKIKKLEKQHKHLSSQKQTEPRMRQISTISQNLIELQEKLAQLQDSYNLNLEKIKSYKKESPKFVNEKELAYVNPTNVIPILKKKETLVKAPIKQESKLNFADTANALVFKSQESVEDMKNSLPEIKVVKVNFKPQ